MSKSAFMVRLLKILFGYFAQPGVSETPCKLFIELVNIVLQELSPV